MGCMRFRPHHHNDGMEDETQPRTYNTFCVGEKLLLRDTELKRFDAPVEFRAADGNLALVLIYGQFERVPLASLRRQGDAAPAHSAMA